MPVVEYLYYHKKQIDFFGQKSISLNFDKWKKYFID